MVNFTDFRADCFVKVVFRICSNFDYQIIDPRGPVDTGYSR